MAFDQILTDAMKWLDPIEWQRQRYVYLDLKDKVLQFTDDRTVSHRAFSACDENQNATNLEEVCQVFAIFITK